MAKQVCDISAGKGGMSRGQSTEHLRDYKVTDPDAKKYGYYDPTRKGLNFEVARGGIITPVNKGYPIDKRFKDICEARGIKIPGPIRYKDGTEKERNIIANIMLGGSRDRMIQLAFGDQKVNLYKGADNSHIVRQPDIEKWAQDQYRLMCKLYGEENIVAFIVHLDEKNPHVHCTLIPEVNGKISYKKLFGGKDKTEARQKFLNLHDAVAEVNAKWGLKRGDNIHETGAKHRTSEEYWTWLRDECNRLEQEKGSLESEVDGLRDSLKLLENEISKNERKVKGLTTMVSNKMTVLQDLEDQRQDLENKVLSNEYELQQVEQQRKNLDSLIQSNQEYLDRRRREIEETKELLELLRKQHAEKLQQVKDASDKHNDLTGKIRQLNKDRIDLGTGAAANGLLKHIAKVVERKDAAIEAFGDGLRRKGLPQIARQLEDAIDKFDLSWFTSNPDETVNAIMTVFLGNQDAESAVQMSSGGGGGGDTGPWRKRDNEDDDEYMQRVVGMVKNLRKRGLKR